MFCSVCGSEFAGGNCPKCAGGAPATPAGSGLAPATTTCGLAIASLVLGIFWLFYVGSILAVIFGHIALNQIKQAGGRLTGRGMAIAGLVLGYLGVAAIPIAIIAALAIPNLVNVKQKATQFAEMATLKSLQASVVSYSAQNPEGACPATLKDLGPAPGAGLIGADLAAADTIAVRGFIISYTPGPDRPCGHYSFSAAPQPGQGTRYYFIDESGTIRYNDGGPANAQSMPVMQ